MKNLCSLDGKKVLVAGSNGMVGSAVCRKLKERNCKIIQSSRSEIDFTRQLDVEKWISTKKPDIIIFEGWCVGAKPQKTKELKKPINVLEKVEDTKLTWRRKVNNELKTNYKKIYNLIDKKIYLKVPNFKYVLKWRLLQEKKLGLKSKNKIMNNKQITRFIMFYERVTKNMLNNFQDNDFVIILDKKHKIKSIKF